MIKKALICVIIALILGLGGLFAGLSSTYYNNYYNFNTPSRIDITNGNGNTRTAVDGTNIEAKEILRLINLSTKQKKLSAILGGTKNKKPKIEAVSETTINRGTNFMITFTYSEEQTLTINGQNYVNPSNSTINNIKYKKIKLIITQTSGYYDAVFAVMDLDNAEKYSYYITQYSDFSELYQYFVEKDIVDTNN